MHQTGCTNPFNTAKSYVRRGRVTSSPIGSYRLIRMIKVVFKRSTNNYGIASIIAIMTGNFW